ncbi:hypothetical protein B0H16DRAFT_1469111 [Mycena metata]|uniref:Thaumatin-like protein n=1 Tax=Mycena metata TaxID=1033252 RepID=A0AAD7HYZ4_9AGAR|nr:hypothetical protein B0H16DRAFT_1469111 [Mycena metata]
MAMIGIIRHRISLAANATATGPQWNPVDIVGSHRADGMASRICDRPPNSGCQNDCFGGIAFGEAACSMTEWTFDSANIGGQTDYDISNIQGFSVPQQIIPDGGAGVVTCTSANCPCNQAYRPGDTSGTCGGTGPVDQAPRVSGSSGYTVVLNFFRQVFAFLDSATFVEMYFPFAATTPNLFNANDANTGFVGTGSMLYNNDGTISAIGQLLLSA